MQHYPKAGGSTAKKLFQWLVAKGHLGKTSLRVHNEFAGIRDSDKSTFKIGLVRDPCEYYVSLWAFGVSLRHKGAFAREMDDSMYHRLYGRSHNYKDVDLFRTWLEKVAGQGVKSRTGVASLRFYSNYISGGKPTLRTMKDKYKFKASVEAELQGYMSGRQFPDKRVHCWARTKTLLADLKECLRQFEDWLGEKTIRWHEIDHLFRERQPSAEGSKQPKSKVNTSPHLPCTSYYGPNDVRRVLASDGHIMRKWKFTCCGLLDWRDGRPVLRSP